MIKKQETLPAKETQFFAIETKGRTGIRDMVHHYQDQMWIARPSYMSIKKKEIYFQKAIMNLSNQESLKPLMASREGLFQIYMALCKAVQLGMNVGGIRPHAYIVPRKKYVDRKFTGEYIATFVPTQDGYRYVVTTGATAIFKDVIWGVVREGYERLLVKESTGEIIHDSDPIKTANTQILGVWVKCVRINSEDIDIVKFVAIDKIHNTRDRYSDSYKYAIKNNSKDGSPWQTDYEEQVIKTALKSVLKHYIGKCEGIAQLDEIEAQEAEQYNNMDIADRAESRLDNVIENQNTDNVPAEKVIENKPAPDPGPSKEDPPKEDQEKDGQLF